MSSKTVLRVQLVVDAEMHPYLYAALVDIRPRRRGRRLLQIAETAVVMAGVCREAGTQPKKDPIISPGPAQPEAITPEDIGQLLAGLRTTSVN